MKGVPIIGGLGIAAKSVFLVETALEYMYSPPGHLPMRADNVAACWLIDSDMSNRMKGVPAIAALAIAAKSVSRGQPSFQRTWTTMARCLGDLEGTVRAGEEGLDGMQCAQCDV